MGGSCHDLESHPETHILGPSRSILPSVMAVSPNLPLACVWSRHMCISVCICVSVLWVCVFTVMHVCGCGCVCCCSFCIPCTNVHIMHENYLTLLCPAVCRLLSLAVDTIPCSVFYLYMFCACHYLSIHLNSRMFKLECHSLILQLVQFIKMEPGLCVLLL